MPIILHGTAMDGSGLMEMVTVSLNAIILTGTAIWLSILLLMVRQLTAMEHGLSMELCRPK